jgi:RNA polymerase sigma-70 factor, ECF subfamily
MSEIDRRTRFETLIAPHLRSLYGTGLRLTRNPDAAADLVQETCLRAYRTFDNFVPGTNAKAWLFTILHSVFVNKYRRDRREPEQVAFDEIDARYERLLAERDPNAWGATPENLRAMGTEVEAALDRLPEGFRTVVLMIDLEELSYEEAAAAIDCPVGTIRSRLFRARRMLFLELHEYAGRAGYPTARRSDRS